MVSIFKGCGTRGNSWDYPNIVNVAKTLDGVNFPELEIFGLDSKSLQASQEQEIKDILFPVLSSSSVLKKSFDKASLEDLKKLSEILGTKEGISKDEFITKFYNLPKEERQQIVKLLKFPSVRPNDYPGSITLSM